MADYLKLSFLLNPTIKSENTTIALYFPACDKSTVDRHNIDSASLYSFFSMMSVRCMTLFSTRAVLLLGVGDIHKLITN